MSRACEMRSRLSALFADNLVGDRRVQWQPGEEAAVAEVDLDAACRRALSICAKRSSAAGDCAYRVDGLTANGWQPLEPRHTDRLSR
jgi:hypothetical protein